jgi:hypothetical protein
MGKWMQSGKLTMLTRVVVLIAIYFLGGVVCKETSFLSGSVALVWPPAGIALAAILLFGYERLKHKYQFAPKHSIDVKGHDPLSAYWRGKRT